MRLPNGFGNVSKLSGKRRNPWRARVTEGWDIVTDPKTQQEKERQIHFNCGCYEKKIHALQALTAYHNNPEVFKSLLELYKNRQITLDELLNLQKPQTSPEKLVKGAEKVGTTLSQLYALWRADESKYGGAKKRADNLAYYDRSFKMCHEIEQMFVDDITLEIMQNIADQSDKSKIVLSRFKVMLITLFKYAVIHDIITPDKNKTEFIDLSNAKEPQRATRERFSPTEIELIWKMKNEPPTEFADTYLSVVLMLLYSGVRISEMLDVKKEDVFLDRQFFKVIDSKTKAGVRIVPIADKTRPFFEFWMNRSNAAHLIIGTKSQHLCHNGFRSRYWNRMMDILKLNHTQHDTRHTCVSMLTEAKVDERWIKKIIGHKGQDITQDIYTNVDISKLIEAINLI